MLPVPTLDRISTLEPLGAGAVRVAATPSVDRIGITFVVGDTDGLGAVVVNSGDQDASGTTGVNYRGVVVSQTGGAVTFYGAAARRRWTFVSLAGTAPVLTTIEHFPEHLGTVPDAPGHPV